MPNTFFECVNYDGARLYIFHFFQSLRMGPNLMAINPTWPSRVNQVNEDATGSTSANLVPHAMSSTSSFSGFGQQGTYCSLKKPVFYFVLAHILEKFLQIFGQLQ